MGLPIHVPMSMMYQKFFKAKARPQRLLFFGLIPWDMSALPYGYSQLKHPLG